jgi:hypothetical protein
MNISTVSLYDKAQTASEMKMLVEKYYGDLRGILINGKPLSKFSLNEFFDYVRKIPYKKDVAPIEVIKRPLYIIQTVRSGADCKKKAILIASYLKCNNIEYRFIGSSAVKSKKIHHVFCQAFINNEWVNLDATYPQYKPYEIKTVTMAEVL